MTILVNIVTFVLFFLQRGIFSNFFECVEHLEADAVLNYKIRDVKLSWTVCDDNLDCGLYLAYFMEQYQGNVDTKSLFKVKTFPFNF